MTAFCSELTEADNHPRKKIDLLFLQYARNRFIISSLPDFFKTRFKQKKAQLRESDPQKRYRLSVDSWRLREVTTRPPQELQCVSVIRCHHHLVKHRFYISNKNDIFQTEPGQNVYQIVH